jgi:hypothetical protein
MQKGVEKELEDLDFYWVGGGKVRRTGIEITMEREKLWSV